MAGMDPLRFLRLRDGRERSLMQVLANAILEREQTRDDNRATKIANAVGKMLGGK